MEPCTCPVRFIDEVLRNSTQHTLPFVCTTACGGMTVCITLDLACIADVYRSQTRLGSHPFIYISPPPLLKGPLHSLTGNHVMLASPPAARPCYFHASPFMRNHDIHITFLVRKLYRNSIRALYFLTRFFRFKKINNKLYYKVPII